MDETLINELLNKPIYPTTKINNVRDDENNNVTELLNNKVDKVSGKRLSTNDYTTAEKSKLANIITYGTADMQEGDPLPTGTIYIQYQN